MILKRFLTAVLLFGLLGLMLFSNSILLAYFIASMFLIGCTYEWAGLVFSEKNYTFYLYLIILLAEILSLSIWGEELYLMLGMVGWSCAIFFILFQPRPLPQLTQRHRIFLVPLGLLILPAFVLAIQSIFLEVEPMMVLNLFVLIACHDTGAYLAGNFWGKKKIAPYISPNKTYMGALGGLLFTIIMASILSFLRTESLTKWLVLSASVVFFAFIGDLFESLIKRLAGVKDSGQLLPGHGGILDRLDSAIACAPFFAYWLQIF